MSQLSQKDTLVNNQFYDLLKDDWWNANDHMIFFLKAESKIKIEYLKKNIINLTNLKILDIGAGAGFISIPLAQMGADVTAVDLSKSSLNTLAKKANELGVDKKIRIIHADAISYKDTNEKYDLVLAFDVLEHVNEPQRIINNAYNLLNKNGIFAYHTLNKTFICWLLYLKLVPAIIKHAPVDVHIHEWNIKPVQMIKWLNEAGFKPNEQIGIRAKILQKGILEFITKRKIESEFQFAFTKNLSLGYLGLGYKIC